MYDHYGENRLNSVKSLIDEAFETGLGRELDVSDLQNYGDRESWYGVIEVFREGLGR